jgi:polar amino acid transport system substrate-binding protein
MKTTLSIRSLLALSIAGLVASCAAPPLVPQSVMKDLAPTGKLRASVNLGNPVLAYRDPKTGETTGVSVDLSRELATRLGVPLELVVYETAGKVVEGNKKGEWDVGYVAIDPARATEIEFSPPYVVIEGAYLVRESSPIRRNADVDAKGVRIAVGLGSAYDLYLTRNIRDAQIVRAKSSPVVVDYFLAEKLEVAAGVKQQLEADAKRVPGLRILEGRFMVINQAIGVPIGREAGKRYVYAFVEEMKMSGFVQQSLDRHRIEGAAVAPRAPAPSSQ